MQVVTSTIQGSCQSADHFITRIFLIEQQLLDWHLSVWRKRLDAVFLSSRRRNISSFGMLLRGLALVSMNSEHTF